MDMYTTESWTIFCEKMNQLFDTENIILPFEQPIISHIEHPEPWNKGKSLGKEWSDVRKQHKFTPKQHQKVLNHLAKLRETMYTEERAQKISKSLRGVPLTEERKRKISESKKGTKVSPETKAKLSALMTGKKRGPYKKKSLT